MALVDVSGTAGGVGFLLDANGAILHSVSGTASGAGSLAASDGVSYIFSGYVAGHGNLLDPFLLPFSGNVAGSGSLTAVQAVVTSNVFGAVYGRGVLALAGAPEALIGQGDVSGYAEVIAVRAICCTCGVGPVQVPWQGTMGPGDLTLSLTDTVCNPISPYAITFTLYRVRGQFLERVGCDNRSPVSPAVGKFYATGIMGDGGGQPGNWMIIWRWQMSFGGAFGEARQTFQVLDAAARNTPGGLVRVKKYGWFD